MELDAPQALVHLLWLGASVDKKIADSEREYIQKVCSHEKIPLKLEELEKHHENNQFDQIYQECVFTFKEFSLDCLLYTSPSPRDRTRSRMPSSA